MTHIELDELEIAPPEVVRQAARNFAASLSETRQFIDFEEAAERLNTDQQAQKAIAAFQTKQQSLQMMIRLNAVSPADQSELERLQHAYLNEASVVGYIQAQQELVAICQAAGEIISQAIGLNYSASCGASCCG
jgi:cell fate (sporulation/competence/biofilm development) regulator YlbF (YheA/YmcA/DUF963 family)